MSLSGCPEEVLLAIVDVSELAHWKAQEMRNGRLSMRALIRRGDSIEQQLRQHSDPQTAFPELNQIQTPKLPSVTMAQLSNTRLEDSSTASAFPDEDTRQLVADIFRETAMLYLHTISSGCNPGTFLATF